ncbi:hypothetical protein [Leucobacter chromiireducens]|uniref:hypothetical protein n=1 Tax=Leucobacter chromiireducens TaxID=283877 RepID=UPI003F7D9094
MFKASESPFIFMTLVAKAAGEQQVKSDFETKAPKLTKDGKQQFITGLKALNHENGQITREQQNVSLSVLSPVDLAPGVMYVAAGEIQVVPYVATNGRIGYSITATTVKPLKAGSAE